MTRYVCMMICVNPGYLWFSFSIFFILLLIICLYLISYSVDKK